MGTASALDRCSTCTRAPVTLASLISRAIAATSAAGGLDRRKPA